MKTLLLLRHAKAEREAPGGDKERNLNGRGRRNARAMGERLPKIAPPVDLIVTSDAARALQTAQIVASASGFTGRVEVEPEIYGADVDDLLEVIEQLPPSAETVMLVGHNPTFEEMATELCSEGTPSITLPTAGLARIEFDAREWREVRPGAGRLVGVYTPKDEGE